MTLIGYTMMCEQAGPKQLVRDVALAEQAGFDFAVISVHYFPWLDSQGHSPYAWSVLGAAAQATERIPLMTYVTCPIRRYHPAVVAQKAATMQLLSDGPFTLGLGAGENLNEHIVGGGWPLAGVRHEMLGAIGPPSSVSRRRPGPRGRRRRHALRGSRQGARLSRRRVIGSSAEGCSRGA
jgi:G6PDH family F420-dependent oxidoreductase